MRVHFERYNLQKKSELCFVKVVGYAENGGFYMLKLHIHHLYIYLGYNKLLKPSKLH